MRELRKRAEQIVKVLCLILAALVLYQLVGIVLRWNPFHGVAVPELPALAAATNGPSGSAHTANLPATVASKGTNRPPHQPSTNLMAVAGSNSNSPSPSEKQTNVIARTEPMPLGTNAINDTATNASTNIVARLQTKSDGTNLVPATLSTNTGTNLLASAAASETNIHSAPKSKMNSPGAMPMPDMAGMGFNPFQPPGKPGANLPPALQSRISRITDSEILGPVMRPLPMALLGIAGDVAFLRSDSGQTGLVKEGDTLADIKLLRIGVNRVLIEQNGQKKELTIFSGYGGESLLPKDSHENDHP